MQTLAGYDWVTKNLARGADTPFEGPRTTTKASKIGVCGELVGGSLATMLALTECHNSANDSGLQGITAVAVNNAIVDWTGIPEAHSDLVPQPTASKCTVRREHKHSPLSIGESLTPSDLSVIRNRLFRKAEAYFDPFASPLLFFRTPSSELPSAHPAAFLPGADGDSEVDAAPVETIRKRRSLRKYPPTGPAMVLPHIRLDCGRDSLLKDQGKELVDLMRKSFKRSTDEDTSLGMGIIDRGFVFNERDGLGLWNQRDMHDIGRWFGEILRQP